MKTNGEQQYPFGHTGESKKTQCFVLLSLKVFAVCVNFPTYETSRIRIFVPPRREERQVRINIISFSLRPLRLCGRYSDSFGYGSAALGPSRSSFALLSWLQPSPVVRGVHQI